MENSKNHLSNKCEWILYLLVFTLVFEGILRKILPGLGFTIFFFKDLLCIVGIILIIGYKLPDIIEKLTTTWKILFFLFLPLLIFTSFKDPILAAFATKQYLLYIIIGILMGISFLDYKELNFRIFMFISILLIIPTTLVAIIQHGLPPSHWLNLSVEGGSLEGFSAAGYLRVGSTFSFTAQYSWYLNAMSFFLATSFFMPPSFKSKLFEYLKPSIYLLLFFMLVLGAFITGGRTAVLGCGATFFLGFFLIGIKRPNWFFSKGIIIIGLCFVGLFSLRILKPEFFKAYDERSSGIEDVSHGEEMTFRILSGFTDWTNWFWDQDVTSVIIGNGLGVMSNGSSQLSTYAFRIRNNGFWTEGDVPTTFWEGGLYLGLIWYSFRLFIIIFCYHLWVSIKNKELAGAASVPFSYIIIHGIIAQFGIQPPLTIWWWFAIGIILFLYRLGKTKLYIEKLNVNMVYEEKSNFH